ERYLDLVEERQNQTSWVFDEYEVASRLHMDGKLQIVAAWKEPTVEPGKLLLRLNVIDMRQHEPGSSPELDAHFPEYEGPALTHAERQTLLAFAQQFDELMAADEPDAEAVRRTLMDNETFEALYDYRVRLADYYWHGGAADAAYPIAIAIRDECQND